MNRPVVLLINAVDDVYMNKAVNSHGYKKVRGVLELQISPTEYCQNFERWDYFPACDKATAGPRTEPQQVLHGSPGVFSGKYCISFTVRPCQNFSVLSVWFGLTSRSIFGFKKQTCSIQIFVSFMGIGLIEYPLALFFRSNLIPTHTPFFHFLVLSLVLLLLLLDKFVKTLLASHFNL